MSAHVHLIPLGGISGDMFVSALLHAMPDLVDPVLADLRAVLPDDVTVAVETRAVSGIAARGFSVSSSQTGAPSTYLDMKQRLEGAQISPEVRARAVTLLTALGQAESAIHDVPLERVHFHEIADWDTLADLTAAAHLIESPMIAGFSLAPLPLGHGTVETAHGRLAVPAPATARLLEGLAVIDDGIPGERVTPTGATIAAALPRGPRPPGTLGPTGYGAGTRVLEGVANVLIAQVIHPEKGIGSDRVTVIAFDVDDMTGEEIATAADRLRATPGVIDLTLTARSGKKNRPVTGFKLLARPELAEAAIVAVFAQTSTLGLRRRDETRATLTRSTAQIGRYAGKRAVRPGGSTVKIEADALADGETLAERRRMARTGGQDETA